MTQQQLRSSPLHGAGAGLSARGWVYGGGGKSGLTGCGAGPCGSSMDMPSVPGPRWTCPHAPAGSRRVDMSTPVARSRAASPRRPLDMPSGGPGLDIVPYARSRPRRMGMSTPRGWRPLWQTGGLAGGSLPRAQAYCGPRSSRACRWASSCSSVTVDPRRNPALADDPAQLGDGPRRAHPLVRHRVAVGAERDEVGDGIKLVAAAELGHRDEVVDRDEVHADLAVFLLEGEPAGRAAAAVVRNAGPPRIGVLFVAVHHDPGDRVLRVGAGTGPGGVRARRRPEVAPQGPDRRFLGRFNAQPGGIIAVPGDPGQRLLENVDGDLLAGRQEGIEGQLHVHRGLSGRSGPAQLRLWRSSAARLRAARETTTPWPMSPRPWSPCRSSQASVPAAMFRCRHAPRAQGAARSRRRGRRRRRSSSHSSGPGSSPG